MSWLPRIYVVDDDGAETTHEQWKRNNKIKHHERTMIFH